VLVSWTPRPFPPLHPPHGCLPHSPLDVLPMTLVRRCCESAAALCLVLAHFVQALVLFCVGAAFAAGACVVGSADDRFVCPDVPSGPPCGGRGGLSFWPSGRASPLSVPWFCCSRAVAVAASPFPVSLSGMKTARCCKIFVAYFMMAVPKPRRLSAV